MFFIFLIFEPTNLFCLGEKNFWTMGFVLEVSNILFFCRFLLLLTLQIHTVSSRIRFQVQLLSFVWVCFCLEFEWSNLLAQMGVLDQIRIIPNPSRSRKLFLGKKLLLLEQHLYLPQHIKMYEYQIKSL